MQDDVAKLPVKKIVVGSLLGCGGLVVVVAVIAAIAVSRTLSTLDDRKPEVVALTDKFADCFYRSDEACLRSLTMWDEAMFDTAPAAAAQFTKHLGARRTATPIDESWSRRTFRSAAGETTTTVSVALNVAYEHDANATETFVVVDDDGKLRVRHYKVNSPMLFVEPSTQTEPVQENTE